MNLEEVIPIQSQFELPKSLLSLCPFLLVFLALVIQYFLEPLVGTRIFLLLYPAIFIGSFLGVFWSSMFATLFAALSASVLLFSGQHSIDTTANSFGVMIFFFTGLVSIYIGHGSLVQKQLISETVNRFSHEFRAAGCECSVIASDQVVVRADPFRLEQVLVNLLTNAIKYAAGKPIEIRTLTSDSFAKIVVKDSGIGISPDKVEKIFDRYERADSDSRINGLGLGLYIVKEIVNQHHGRVFVESELDKGSTFTVEIPLAHEAHAFLRPGQSSHENFQKLN